MGLAKLLALLITVAVSVTAVPAGASHEVDVPVRRWYGAEAGYIETRCWGPSTDAGCWSFNSTASPDATVSSDQSHTLRDDPDLVRRQWPSRTGARHFFAGVPGGIPSVAHLTTLGAPIPPSAPMTASFAVRFHTLPLQPVAIYRHPGAAVQDSVTITLTPEGRLSLSTLGLVGVTAPLTTQAWHTVTVSYGSKKGAVVRLHVNDQPPIEGSLPAGAPSGHLDLGIVSPTSVPFTMAIDDYVESSVVNAPIRKARINYLMPLGAIGQDSWSKVFAVPNCRDAARNWQLVSENQYVFLDDVGSGAPGYCPLEGGAIKTSVPESVDTFLLEGVPSQHKPAFGYARDVAAQPAAGSEVLAVRVRMRGRTDGPPVSWNLGYVDQGRLENHRFDFESGAAAGYVSAWGRSHERRPNGERWTAGSLNGLQLRLDSSGGNDFRYVTELHLDYVWVP